MTKPKNPVQTPAESPVPPALKDGDALHGTWPGEVPGAGKSPPQKPHGTSDDPVDPAVSGDVADPNQLASAGPEGAPQPKPREEDPGINANVVS